MDSILDFPDLTLGTASVGRGIHDNSVIMVSTADFPLHKFYAVINQPADGFIGQTGGNGVFLGSVDHALGGVHMGDAGSGCRGGQSGAACIGKKI